LRIFSIPAGAPFLASLARALLNGELVAGFPGAGGPLALADATIYVPTRRAARALGEALRQASGGPSLILPRIAPLGAFEPTQDGLLFEEPDSIREAPAAVSELGRRMVLAQLARAWGRALKGAIVSIDASGKRRFDIDESPLVIDGPAQAFALAADLAGLIDDMTIEEIPWERLEALAPGDFDAYWRITLDFLKIAAVRWPAHLREHGLVDRAARGAMLVEDEIASLTARSGPVIVAGSTGARRATAKLIGAVARAPQGAVVLPDLDLALDELSWRMIGEEAVATHPQAGLSRLLKAIGATRDDVREIGVVPQALRSRAAMTSEALRPANSTDLWRSRALPPDKIEEALADVSVIEAADEGEEALALAIVLREVLETPGKCAALITPDLGLTRRVKAELGRWGVDVEDSAGRTLGETPAGVFARLILAAALSQAPLDLLALVTHPLARLRRAPRSIAAAARALEIGALRGVTPASGLSNPERVIRAARAASDGEREDDARRRLSEEDWRDAESLLRDALTGLAPLAALSPKAPLEARIAAHRAMLEAFCRAEDGADLLRATPDGATLLDLLDEWREAAPPDFALEASDYGALFDLVAAGQSAPETSRPASRLQILGLLEARLLAFDMALIAGLDETIWPPAAETDAFLNRPMRAALGLSEPERRIGQTAHDFVAALGAPQAILSRARKRDGAPTVASRFLQRIAAAAGEASFSAALKRGEAYLALARRIDRPIATARAERPTPKPPATLRPKALSVTRIETLRRDPYAIFAERILRLKPLDPIGARVGPREIGVLSHAALREFSEGLPLRASSLEERQRLMRIARGKFATVLEDDSFRLLNWPRIEQGLDFFLGYDRQRLPFTARLLNEEQGRLAIGLSGGAEFVLSAVADRIEILEDGSISLVDFKTGAMPGVSEVRVGFSPQLTLEAAMIARGAFKNAPGRMPADARYLKLGGADGGAIRELNFGDEAFADVVEEHYGALLQLLEQFADEDTPYLSRPYPKFLGAKGVYDHLARVKEWSASGGLEGVGETP
jgi:ATP-dependent helicase/nuclease subunit B